MDSIRVSKVTGVLCIKSATTLLGTVHLTAHHLIFRYDDQRVEEMWLPYPLISQVTRLPQTLRGQSPLNFFTRTFETFILVFGGDSDASDVFNSVKELTVASSVAQLYAFFYHPSAPLTAESGWSIYSPRDEFGRMGLGIRTKAWRFTDVNKDYSFSPTYPARLVVPTRISDATLQYASKYRSKARIPALTYLHWGNFATITRASQPMVGITQNRSIQDEKLIEAIFQSHHAPSQRVASGSIYGATATNLIVDARPNVNAVANTAKGAGTENMDNYKEAKKIYLGIDHIHTMRDSLAKLVEALKAVDGMIPGSGNDPEQSTDLVTLDKQALRRSGWLRHISILLEGTLAIVRNVHINSSHVFIHCSDGWDRTSQLSALAQLCLDPFYRTIRGFEILVEKDWVSFGHKFLDRCGHLSSDKFFITPPAEPGHSTNGADAAQAFLTSVQNRFASQHHVKETSPTFHQFLECVRQLQRQFPNRFEFNERFLRKLHYHLYSCQFGTFLLNTERERRCAVSGPPPCEQTVSVWDLLNSASEMELNKNPLYDPSLDHPASRVPSGDMGVLLPNSKDVRFWHELYGRTDEEMNGNVIGVFPEREIEAMNEGPEDGPIPSPPESLPSLPTFNSLSPRPHSRSISPSPTESPIGTSSPSGGQSSGLLPSAPTAHLSNRQVVSKPADFFSGGGMKSMWGKFSSNATAAFSVVQEAYQEATKDFKLPSSNSEYQAPKPAELQPRTDIHLWQEGQSIDTTFAPTFPVEINNPWATQTRPSSSSHDSPNNPWASVRSDNSAVAITSRTSPVGASGMLPDDPTIERPPLRSAPHVISQPTKVPDGAGQFTPSPNDSGSQTSSSLSYEIALLNQSDPLGVGLL